MIFRRLALLLAVPGALALPGSAEAVTPTSANAVAVYDFNVNVFSKNWQGWFDAINSEVGAPLPDIVLGQDFASPTAVNDFNNMLYTKFGQTYSYDYSVAPSGAATNRRAVFWRTARFGWIKSDKWAGYGGTASTCPTSPGQDNAQAIQVLLDDKSNNYTVGAVSMKTPPMGTDNECAWKNAQLATSKLARSTWAASLHFFGTDANAADWSGSNYYCWYRGTVSDAPNDCAGTDLGWSDPMFDACALTLNQRNCLNSNWTHKNQSTGATSRIDFLFAKRGLTAEAVSTQAKTIDQGVCWSYSDHCSVRAVVSYGTTF